MQQVLWLILTAVVLAVIGTYLYVRRKRGLPAPEPVHSGEDASGHRLSETEDKPTPRATEIVLGMTKAEVMRIQGIPTDVSGGSLTTLKYGNSQFQFEDDKLTGWDNHDRNLKLSRSTKSKAIWFTLGSTKDDVISAMGPPDAINWFESEWSYGRSYLRCSNVNFENGRVSGWHSDEVELKLAPAEPAKTNVPFTYGSTKAEVIAAQGSPLEVNNAGNEFRYAEGSVSFDQTGKVTAWSRKGERGLNAAM